MPSKKSISDLAIFGGEKAFAKPLHVGRPNIGDRKELYRRLDDILDRKWLTNDGPFVQELERKVAQFLGVANCVAVCNATLGLQLVAKALDITGEVIMPAFTFVATAHAFKWLGLRPVFADIESDSHTIDVTTLEKLINPKTAAIVGVHTWGRPCKVSELEDVARTRNLKLVYDASHAFGCSFEKAFVGRFGDAEVFSLHATKVINSFEGGLITTGDDSLADRLRNMRNFGFSGMDRVEALGINAKMNEFSAAVGITGLDSFPEIVDRNRENYESYKAGLANVSGIRLRRIESDEMHNYQYIVLEMEEQTFVLRDYLVDALHAENILARRYFYPGCHRSEPYLGENMATDGLPVTEAVADRVIVLPTGCQVSIDDIATICSIIGLALEAPLREQRNNGSCAR